MCARAQDYYIARRDGRNEPWLPTTYLFEEATCSSVVISRAVSMAQFLSLPKHLCARVNASITVGAAFGRVESGVTPRVQRVFREPRSPLTIFKETRLYSHVRATREKNVRSSLPRCGNALRRYLGGSRRRPEARLISGRIILNVTVLIRQQVSPGIPRVRVHKSGIAIELVISISCWIMHEAIFPPYIGGGARARCTSLYTTLAELPTEPSVLNKTHPFLCSLPPLPLLSACSMSRASTDRRCVHPLSLLLCVAFIIKFETTYRREYRGPTPPRIALDYFRGIYVLRLMWAVG